MPVTTPPTITALPTPPDPNDRSTFNTRAYPWSVAQQTLATEVGAVADNVYDNATEAVAAATAADFDAAAVAADKISAAASAVTATTQKGLAETAAATATTQAGIATVQQGLASAAAVTANAKAVEAAAAAATATAVTLGVSTGHPTVRPSLNLDFANSQTVDPRITFTRGGASGEDTDTTTEQLQLSGRGATFVGRNGLIQYAKSNAPRLDYDPVTLDCKGLLIEEQRTNLLLYSQDFDNAAWSKSRTTVTANATTAPDGTLTADKLVEDTTATNTHVLRIALFTAVAATTYSFSMYVKAAERSAFQLLYVGGNAGPISSVDFDLSAGTRTIRSGTNAAAATITSVGSGWFRCSLTIIDESGGAGAYFDLRMSDSAVSSTATGDIYEGNGTSGIFIWGAQLEAGSFPTSYIPTTTAQVTRAAEIAAMTGANFSSWYRSDAGCLLAESDVRSGGNVLTLGSASITSSASVKTKYTVAYSASPSATTLAIGNGVHAKVAYYPLALSTAQQNALKA